MARSLSAYIEIEIDRSKKNADWHRLDKMVNSLRQSSLNGYKVEAVDLHGGDSCVVPWFGYKGEESYPLIPQSLNSGGIKRWFGINIVIDGNPTSDEIFGSYIYDKDFKACLIVCGISVPKETRTNDWEKLKLD
jgi:hypothetical protein